MTKAYAILESLMSGTKVPAGPQHRSLRCVYCHVDIPEQVGWDGHCACGAPIRSTLFARDEHGVPYPSAVGGWPR